jgi:hypothetical protein
MKRMSKGRGLGAAATVAGLVLTSQVVGQSAASASSMSSAPVTARQSLGGPLRALPVVFEPPCRSQRNNYIICFSITQIGVSSGFNVHVGIDVSMSQQDAQNIIDAPGEAFSATLRGEDTFFDDTLKHIPVTWSSAWEGGLSAEFDTFASAETLDEDSDGTDEIFAHVTLHISSTDQNRYFRTNNINEPFHLYR